ncbi:DUF4855 domain-containing protein [Limibacterium fermenti]|uniref:DUF4855 domain-containing protein n=1 Tax=Limibacterium fermenti TaxID=3229863 RepID=UPI000E836D86|nr:DUF4855 domain-containing protein [Porphyromonadaceae bacterium]
MIKKVLRYCNFLFIMFPLLIMCNDKEHIPNEKLNPVPENGITKYILSAEVVNKKGALVTFDNAQKVLFIKIPRYLNKTDLKIKLHLNDGVSMIYPLTQEAEYNLLDTDTKIWLKSGGKTIIFEVKYEDIIGEDSAIGKADIRDMVLIYDGGAHRTIVWNEKMLEAYISIDNKNKEQKRWLFDGFLFLEIHNGTRGFASGYRSLPARKVEWIGLMNGYLKEGKSLRALNDGIESVKPYAPDYGKRKIVMSLPEPIPNQKDWGELNGKIMNFSSTQDRIEAVKWYIDFLIEEFKKAELNNLQLAGFYWLAEEATNTRTILKEISDYIKSKDLKFYWIPYYNTDGWNEWKALGFDKAYQQPNYFFSTSIPDSRIDDACRRAQEWGMDLELEFDNRASGAGGGWGSRLKTYIDGFKKNGVFENNDLAYYEGSGALYILKNGDIQDKALFQELADIIAERQEKFYGK